MEKTPPLVYNEIFPHTTIRRLGIEYAPCCCANACVGITLLSQPPEEFQNLFSTTGNIVLEQDDDGYYFNVTGPFEIILSNQWMQIAGNGVSRPGGFEISLTEDSIIGQQASIHAKFQAVRPLTLKAWYDAITLYYDGDYGIEAGKIAQNTYKDPLSGPGWDQSLKPTRFRVAYEGVEHSGEAPYRGPFFIHCSAGTHNGAEVTSCSTALAFEQFNPGPSPFVIYGSGNFKIRDLAVLDYYSQQTAAEKKMVLVDPAPDLEEGQYKKYYYSLVKTIPGGGTLPPDSYFVGETVFESAYDSETSVWYQRVVADYPQSGIVFMCPPWTNQTIYDFSVQNGLWNGMILSLPKEKTPCRRRNCTIFQSSHIEDDTTFKKPWLSEPWVAVDTQTTGWEETILARQGKIYVGSVFFRAEESGENTATIGFHYKTAAGNPTISTSIGLVKNSTGYGIYRGTTLLESLPFGEWAALHFVRREKRLECFLMTQSNSKKIFFTYVPSDWLYQLEASSTYREKCYVRFAYVDSVKFMNAEEGRMATRPVPLEHKPGSRTRCGGFTRAEYPCKNECLDADNSPSSFLVYVSFDVILQPCRVWIEEENNTFRYVYEYMQPVTISWGGNILLVKKESINGDQLFAGPTIIFKKGTCPGTQKWGSEEAYQDAITHNIQFPYPIFLAHTLSLQTIEDQLYQGCRLRPVCKMCLQGCSLVKTRAISGTETYREEGQKIATAIPFFVPSSDFVYSDQGQNGELFNIYNECGRQIMESETTTETTSAEGNISSHLGTHGGLPVFLDSIQIPETAPCNWGALVGTTRDSYPPGVNYSMQILGVQ